MANSFFFPAPQQTPKRQARLRSAPSVPHFSPRFTPDWLTFGCSKQQKKGSFRPERQPSLQFHSRNSPPLPLKFPLPAQSSKSSKGRASPKKPDWTPAFQASEGPTLRLPPPCRTPSSSRLMKPPFKPQSYFPPAKTRHVRYCLFPPSLMAFLLP